jgi:hypothetical protein
LVTGGPPCQPFSLGGKHRAHADSRDMWPEAVRAAARARPGCRTAYRGCRADAAGATASGAGHIHA